MKFHREKYTGMHLPADRVNTLLETVIKHNMRMLHQGDVVVCNGSHGTYYVCEVKEVVEQVGVPEPADRCNICHGRGGLDGRKCWGCQ